MREYSDAIHFFSDALAFLHGAMKTLALCVTLRSASILSSYRYMYYCYVAS